MAIRAWPGPHPPFGVPFVLNRASPQAVGLRAWWPFGAGAGSLARDMATGRAHGTASGAPLVADSIGSARSFNGTTDYIDVGSVEAVNIGGVLTLSGWINLSTWSFVGGGSGAILADCDASALNFQYGLGVNASGKLIAVWGAAGTPLTGSNTAISLNTWHHFAMVRSGSTGAWVATYYLDGLADGSVSTATNPSSQSGLAIGRYGGLGLGGYRIIGRLADIRIHNRDLSAAEVFQLCVPQTRWQLYGIPVFRRPGPPASVIFRRTLGQHGARIGSRQVAA